MDNIATTIDSKLAAIPDISSTVAILEQKITTTIELKLAAFAESSCFGILNTKLGALTTMTDNVCHSLITLETKLDQMGSENDDTESDDDFDPDANLRPLRAPSEDDSHIRQNIDALRRTHTRQQSLSPRHLRPAGHPVIK